MKKLTLNLVLTIMALTTLATTARADCESQARADVKSVIEAFPFPFLENTDGSVVSASATKVKTSYLSNNASEAFYTVLATFELSAEGETQENAAMFRVGKDTCKILTDSKNEPVFIAVE